MIGVWRPCHLVMTRSTKVEHWTIRVSARLICLQEVILSPAFWR
jgi:hypothetical protein